MVTRALDIVVLGPPGAGKGTQAKQLAEAFQLLHMSTGDLLRDEAASGSLVGEEAKGYMDRGELVPDAVVGKILVSRLHSQSGALGCVFDGYPRNAKQAQWLDGLLAEMGRRVDVAIHLGVPDDEILRRLVGRRSCLQCGRVYHVSDAQPAQAGICDDCGASLVQRDDDREDVVRERLKVYAKATAPLLELYRSRSILADVDGTGSRDQVFGLTRRGIEGVLHS